MARAPTAGQAGARQLATLVTRRSLLLNLPILTGEQSDPWRNRADRLSLLSTRFPCRRSEQRMAQKDIAGVLKTAEASVLNEILREAEARLGAQLSAAIAADQRAMTFLGFLLTLVAFLVGASIAAATANTPAPSIAILAAFGAAGFMVAGLFAYGATRPIDFEFVGNDPESWLTDVKEKTSLHDALAEQSAHYDGMLKANRAAMAASSKALRTASIVAGLTVAVCSLAVVAKIVFGW